MTKRIPASIVLTTKLYLLVLAIFSLFRLILFLTELDRVGNASSYEVFQAFFMGVRFDTVIFGYIIALPFVVLSVLYTIHKNNPISRTLIAAMKLFILLFYSLAFVVCAADIPYFNHFFSRFSTAAFQWADSPAFVFNMIIEEPRYFLIIIPLFILIVVFVRAVNKFFRDYKNDGRPINRLATIGLSILFTGLIFLGIRGRVDEKSPILVGTAYFGNNPLLNQLGLNPNFTLIRSYLDDLEEENKEVKFMDTEIAIKNVQSYLNITHPNPEYPLLRKVSFDSSAPSNCNVVLVLMESMSAAKMTRHGNTNNLTPFLDSLSYKGHYFQNAYTAGVHTMNGIFSTLCSYPALYRQHPMKESSMQKYMGLYPTLREKGYSTIYFTTHDGQFDNVEGFLKANDCETVVSKSDYPSKYVKTTLGVPDDYMFQFSIPKLNDLHEKGKPFFATFMTASDHGPYYIPEYFKPRTGDIKQQIVEYADYSLRKFLQMAATQKWFNNTLFVFIADHGAPMDNVYDMSLAYHHTPLIFYCPALIPQPRQFDKIASQMDVFPSIMGLLKQPYYNNTFGIDLFSEDRRFALLNAHTNIGAINNKWFLLVRKDNTLGLFKYEAKDLTNYSADSIAVAKEMETYLKSHLQVFQHIKKTNKQLIDKNKPQ